MSKQSIGTLAILTGQSDLADHMGGTRRMPLVVAKFYPKTDEFDYKEFSAPFTGPDKENFYVFIQDCVEGWDLQLLGRISKACHKWNRDKLARYIVDVASGSMPEEVIALMRNSDMRGKVLRSGGQQGRDRVGGHSNGGKYGGQSCPAVGNEGGRQGSHIGHGDIHKSRAVGLILNRPEQFWGTTERTTSQKVSDVVKLAKRETTEPVKWYELVAAALARTARTVRNAVAGIGL